MRPWTETMSDWLVDYYALTTVVLVAAVVVMGRLRQPARRLSVARSAVVGLAMLAVLAALPGWPRASWRSPARANAARSTDRRRGVGAGFRDHDARSTRGPGRSLGTRCRRVRPCRLGVKRASGPAAHRRSRPSVHRSGYRRSNGRPIGWTSPAGRSWPAGPWCWPGSGSACGRRPSSGADRDPRRNGREMCWHTSSATAGPRRTCSSPSWLAQPVAVGLLRPAIILPERFVEDEPRRRLEAALAHEWAHFRNRDLWWIALSGLLMPVLFAHPVYWWLRRRTREDQELLADAAAADGRVDYAEALLSWARQTPDRPRLAAAGSLALWERPSQLKRRILMLLDRDFRVEPTCPRRWGLGVRGGMALAVLALSVLTFRPAAVGADPAGSPVAPQAGRNPDPKASNGTESGATVTGPRPGRQARRAGCRVLSDQTYHPNFMDHDPRTAVLLTRTGPDGSFRLSPEDAKAALDHGTKAAWTARPSSWSWPRDAAPHSWTRQSATA